MFQSRSGFITCSVWVNTGWSRHLIAYDKIYQEFPELVTLLVELDRKVGIKANDRISSPSPFSLHKWKFTDGQHIIPDDQLCTSFKAGFFIFVNNVCPDHALSVWDIHHLSCLSAFSTHLNQCMHSSFSKNHCHSQHGLMSHSIHYTTS